MPTQTPFADYQVTLMQAQRAQNLANALRQQSFQPVESYDSGVLKAPISYTQGLAKMLQAYAANKGEERAIQNMGQAYGMQGKMLEGMFGGSQAGGSTISSGPPMQMAQNPQTPNPTPEQYGQNITNSAMTGQPSANEPQVTQPQMAQLTPQGTPGLRLPPGQTPSSMANMMMFSPQIAGQVIGAYNKPDDTTLRLMNMGIDPMSPYGQQAQRAIIQKEGYIAPLNLRPGSVPGDPYTGMPLPSAPAVGAAQAQNAGQIERAKQMNTIFPNMTVGGREGVPVWGGDIPHLGRSNPVQPPSQVSSVPTPSISPTNTGFGMSPGTKAASGEMGKSGAGRFNSIVQLASESPMRINVLDNIINLSQEGVTTGPGQEWKNKVAGYIGNTPLLSMVPGIKNASTAVGKFQELQKFTYQNALRNWQAAGGTGTDAQMEAASHANPNDTLFPQALQQIAKWGKASELALQAKANAQDQWLSQPSVNGDTSRQYEFENLWRQHFDPRIYQMTLMNPSELNQFTAKIPPQERQTILNKYRFAKQNGWIQ